MASRAGLRGALLGGALALCECGPPAPSVVVRLDTDAPLSRLLTIQVLLARGDAGAGSSRVFVRGQGAVAGITTPASFGTTPAAGDPLEQPVNLVIDARLEGTSTQPAVSFRRTLRYRFTPHTTTYLSVFLPVGCGARSSGCTSATGDACTVSARCEEQGLTCGDDGRCVPVDVVPTPSADASNGMDATVTPLEAGVDALARDAPAVDSPAVDSPAMDAPRADAPPADSGCPGACPTPAHGVAVCVDGGCGVQCSAGWGDCDGDPSNGCEAALDTAARCGSCGNACGSGAPVCQGGACVTGCGALTLCGTSCVDLQSSDTNCGLCGRACAGGQRCASGLCACPAGLLFCGGACVDPRSDPSHCGLCGRACGGGQTCVAGVCECSSGATLCGGSCVNTQTDSSNCGACGRVCGAGQSCQSGSCACAPGRLGCAGACVDPQTDRSNCGACGRACPGACRGGACAPGNDLCAAATPVTALNTDYAGTTCGAGGEVTNCASGNPDVFFAVRVPTLGSAVVVNTVSGGPFSLALLGTACTAAAVYCAGSGYAGAFVPGNTYYVGVLSPPGSCGSFTLQVH